MVDSAAFPASTRDARTLAQIAPDSAIRRAWAGLFLEAIDVARSVAAESWTLTAHRGWLRLSVGQIAVLELWGRHGFVYTCAPIPLRDASDIAREPNHHYRAVPEATDKWRVAQPAIRALPEVIRRQHRALVRLAASLKRVSPFRRSHSPGFVEAFVIACDGDGSPSFADELPANSYPEGAVRKVTVNAYERNPAARAACIAHHGARCSACGMDFGSVYGPAASGYIHVHHLRPIAEVGARYLVDPINDLRPVCANCHAVIHLGGTTRELDTVRAMLASARSELTIVEPDERAMEAAAPPPHFVNSLAG